MTLGIYKNYIGMCILDCISKEVTLKLENDDIVHLNFNNNFHYIAGDVVKGIHEEGYRKLSTLCLKEENTVEEPIYLELQESSFEYIKDEIEKFISKNKIININ